MPTIAVVFAPHFEEESKRLGATPTHISAGRRLAQLYAEENELAEIKDIEVTRHPKFYPWQRLKEKRFTVRVIVEQIIDDQGNETITVHCALPRWSDTYDEVKALWKKYRTRITPPPQTSNP